MDETEENERGFEQVIDGYEFLSSADSDIEITDQPTVSSPPSSPPPPLPAVLPPPVVSPSLSSSTDSTYRSSHSTVVSHTSSDPDAAINETISVDTDIELDERVSEPEHTDTGPHPQGESSASPPTSLPPMVEAPTAPDPTTTTTLSSSADPTQASTSRPGPPKSDFQFKPPAVPKFSQPTTTQPAKTINLSSRLPTTNTTTTTSGPSSS
ncbi:hypothetical protein MBANPS3_012663, partial [Mucor bainieri]